METHQMACILYKRQRQRTKFSIVSVCVNAVNALTNSFLELRMVALAFIFAVNCFFVVYHLNSCEESENFSVQVSEHEVHKSKLFEI